MSKKGNGEGTIYYSETLKKWVGQFVAGRKENGKLNRKSVYGSTRKEVKEKMINAQAEIQNKTYLEKNDITLNQVIDLYINQLYNSNTINTSTYNSYLHTKQRIQSMKIVNFPIQKITIKDINDCLNQNTNYSNTTIGKNYGLIKLAFNYAMINRFINQNPFLLKGAIIRPKSIKDDEKVEALEFDEQKLLLEELKVSNDKYVDIFYIALYTGMRIGEILALYSNDIDIENKTIHVQRTLTRNDKMKFMVGNKTKTYAGKRDVPIFSDIFDLMKNLSKKDGLLFLDENKIIAPTTINTHFKRICKRAKIKLVYEDCMREGRKHTILTSDVKTHMLRHTFATRCIEAGMSPVVLQKILGHKRVQVTLDTYTSVFNKYKDKEMKKVEKYFSQLH